MAGRLKIVGPKVRTVDTRRVAPPPKKADSFYLKAEWKSFIGALIAVRGRRCEDCGRTDCRIFGDHIKELQDGGAPLDPTNVKLRCGSCHITKTAQVRKERAQTVYG